MMVLLVVLALAGPAATALAGSGKELVVCSWGGTFDKALRQAYWDPFEKETGIKVIAVGPPRAAKVKAMVDSGKVEWDIVVAGYGIFGQCFKKGLLEKVDYKYFDQKTLDQLYPSAKQDFAVGTFYFSVVNAYNTEAFPTGQHPKSWKDFWDVKKFPGPRSLMSLDVAGASSWEFALLADGMPVGDLYNDYHLPRAFKKLKEIKPEVVKWWIQSATAGQLLNDKEAVLAAAYNGRIQNLIDKGAPLAIEWNEGMLWLEYLFTPKGAPNYDNAMKFMAFQARADRQAELSKIFSYGPVNKEAFAMLSPERAKTMPSYPDNAAKQFTNHMVLRRCYGNVRGCC